MERYETKFPLHPRLERDLDCLPPAGYPFQRNHRCCPGLVVLDQNWLAGRLPGAQQALETATFPGLFFVVLLLVDLLGLGVEKLLFNLNYLGWFTGLPPFERNLLVVEVPRVLTGGLIVLILLALTGSYGCFFFVAGCLNAPAKPIPFILTRPPAWNRLGPTIAAAMSLGLLVFVFVFGRTPSPDMLPAILALLPWVLLFAASNAFGEEMLYRASWLAALERPLGPTQALLITTVHF